MIRSSAVFSRSALVPEYLRYGGRQRALGENEVRGQPGQNNTALTPARSQQLCIASSRNRLATTQHIRKTARPGPCAPGEHGQECGRRGVRRDGHLGRCIAILAALLAAGSAAWGGQGTRGGWVLSGNSVPLRLLQRYVAPKSGNLGPQRSRLMHRQRARAAAPAAVRMQPAGGQPDAKVVSEQHGAGAPHGAGGAAQHVAHAAARAMG